MREQKTALIDGKKIEISPGESILRAARRAGIDVPTLCYDDRLRPSASCRLCVVKVEGRRLPIASCAHELEPGMEIVTTGAELAERRRTIVNLVLSENPESDCRKCRELGPCELHALARKLGAENGKIEGATSGALVEDANPFILRDYANCIYCYRCTRVCGEVEQAHAIIPAGRGFESRIATPFDGSLLDSPCTFCGQCIQTCPTGALMDKKMLGKARAEEVTKVRSVCPFCGTGCGINLHVARGEVIGVTPDWQAPANEGSLCVKGQFGTDFIHHPDRLTSPLVRKNGKFAEASWDEAYDLIVEKFARIKEESGPGAFAFWSSSRGTSESNYLMQKFARAVIGTNNIDNCART
jgi:predicted molibdopterin-dependent oxidoreductase YjgC